MDTDTMSDHNCSWQVKREVHDAIRKTIMRYELCACGAGRVLFIREHKDGRIERDVLNEFPAIRAKPIKQPKSRYSAQILTYQKRSKGL